MGRHSNRQARIVFYDVAQEQIQAMSPADRARLEPVLDTIASNPQIGDLSKNASYREYRRGPVRVLYVPTALGTLVRKAVTQYNRRTRSTSSAYSRS